MKKTTLALFAAITLASAPALAHRHDTDHARFRDRDARAAYDALEHRDDALRRRLTTLRTGSHQREQIAEERHEIHHLQKRLERGENIDSFELARALGPSYAEYDRARHGRDHRARYDRS